MLSSVCNEVSLVVAGMISFINGTVTGGLAISGISSTLQGVNFNNFCSLISKPNYLDFSRAKQEMIALSAYFFSLKDTTTNAVYPTSGTLLYIFGGANSGNKFEVVTITDCSIFQTQFSLSVMNAPTSNF